MKILLHLLYIGLAVSILSVGCEKKPTDFRDFFDGHEIIYPGVASDVMVHPGDGRVGISWKPSPDPSIAKYVFVWNNGADSAVFTSAEVDGTDTMATAVIGNLSEYAYTFVMYAYDAQGNRSVPVEINNVRVYGPLYTNALLNRPIDAGNPYTVSDQGAVTLNFTTPDTININTTIRYTNTQDETVDTDLSPDNNSVTLPDYKPGTPVLYNSSYIPERGAIDTFYAPQYDTFPAIYTYVQCDKSLFAEMSLPYDMGVYQSDTRVSKLWDGSVGPQSYPNIFHNDGGLALPAHFSFDMGAVYNNLGRVEETGRDCCNNPDDFEIWGIADTTGAVLNISGSDANWKSEALAKGWTLLKEVVRADDGVAAYKTDLMTDPPPVRFIMIRVLHTTTGSNYVNLSELTFWNKQ